MPVPPLDDKFRGKHAWLNCSRRRSPCNHCRGTEVEVLALLLHREASVDAYFPILQNHRVNV
jgi:hypothetical protein